MRIFALDASTEACSVALWQDNTFDCLFEIAPQQHSKIILPMAQRLLQRHHITFQDCNAIAFAQGPGSFTGLRIAAAVAQGFSLAHNIPLIPISTLASLAFATKNYHTETGFVVAALDARMQEVYYAVYRVEHNTVEAIIPDCLRHPAIAAEELNQQLIGKSWIGIGSGMALLQPYLTLPAQLLLPDEYPSAREVALLALPAYVEGKSVPVAEGLPQYLRNDIVHKKT